MLRLSRAIAVTCTRGIFGRFAHASATPTEQIADFALHPRGTKFLPKELLNKYDKLLRGYDRRPLQDDAKRVSQALRDRSRSDVQGLDKQADILLGPEVREAESMRPTLEDVFNVVYGPREVAAYVAIRFPRVFAAVTRIMTEVSRRNPDWIPKSMMDFGSGPASSVIAARYIWGRALNEVMAIEPSTPMMDAAQALIPDARGVTWRKFLLTPKEDIGAIGKGYDLVTSAYVLTEIAGAEQRAATVRNLWRHTNDTLVIVEPGTPTGFDVVRAARATVLEMGNAHVLAPCPHDGACPMPANSWCHFITRLHRTRAQKSAKAWANPRRADEKEKYSYVVLRRGPRPSPTAVVASNIISERIEQQIQREQEEQDEDEDEGSDDETMTFESESSESSDEEELVQKPARRRSVVHTTGGFRTAEGAIAAKSSEVSTKTSAQADVSSESSASGSDDEEQTEQLTDSQMAAASIDWPRYIRQPIKRKGHVIMDLCCADGTLQRRVVTRSRQPRFMYRLARKARWGDQWPHGVQQLVLDGRGRGPDRDEQE